jgi:formate/nitrite transporter
MVSSVMSKEITMLRMLKRWGLVYIANFVGSILVSLLFMLSGLWKTGGGALGEAAVRIAYGKVTLPFLEAMVRGIGCNWLVCLAVWMALAAKQTIGKVAAIFFPIMGFVAIGFEHSVANMYFIPTGLLLNQLHDVALPSGGGQGVLTWGALVVRNLVPVTIGNIVGGAVFVAMSYWSAYLRPIAGGGGATR